MKLLQSTDGNYVELTVLLHHKTDKALCVSMDGHNKVWIPMSLCEDITLLVGDLRVVALVIPEWLAIQKNLV